MTWLFMQTLLILQKKIIIQQNTITEHEKVNTSLLKATNDWQ